MWAVYKYFTTFNFDTSGAVNPTLDALFRSQDKLARAPGTTDKTLYGLSAANTL